MKKSRTLRTTVAKRLFRRSRRIPRKHSVPRKSLNAKRCNFRGEKQIDYIVAEAGGDEKYREWVNEKLEGLHGKANETTRRDIKLAAHLAEWYLERKSEYNPKTFNEMLPDWHHQNRTGDIRNAKSPVETRRITVNDLREQVIRFAHELLEQNHIRPQGGGGSAVQQRVGEEVQEH